MDNDFIPLFSYAEALELDKEKAKLIQVYQNRLEAISDFVSGFRDRRQSISPDEFFKELAIIEESYSLIL